MIVQLHDEEFITLNDTLQKPRSRCNDSVGQVAELSCTISYKFRLILHETRYWNHLTLEFLALHPRDVAKEP